MREKILRANEKEDFLPETSFGAEVVPESQRPVNEYLDMARAPLFGWASNEVGMQGVSQLLRKLSLVCFHAMAYASMIDLMPTAS